MLFYILGKRSVLNNDRTININSYVFYCMVNIFFSYLLTSDNIPNSDCAVLF